MERDAGSGQEGQEEGAKLVREERKEGRDQLRILKSNRAASNWIPLLLAVHHI